MTDSNKLAHRLAIYNLHFVGPRFGEKIRLIAGAGINLIGAGVLLSGVLVLPGWPL